MLLAGVPLAAETVPDGSPLRAALLDVLRRLLETQLDPPVEFTILDLRARDDFAFVHVTIQRAGGAPIDLGQKFPSPFPAGTAANDAMAILRREGGAWKVFEYDIGISDAILDEWRAKRRRFVG
jgi:hypothetical protein